MHTVRALALSALVGAAVGLVMRLKSERMEIPRSTAALEDQWTALILERTAA